MKESSLGFPWNLSGASQNKAEDAYMQKYIFKNNLF